MSDYRNLKVWHRTLDFVSGVYRITSHFPTLEQYGLTNQIRRAATSVALNIAEGATSGYDNEYGRFLRLAIRSVNEVAAGFEIAKRLTYCQLENANQQIQEADEIASMLQGLARSLHRTGEAQVTYNVSINLLDTVDQDFFSSPTNDESLTTRD